MKYLVGSYLGSEGKLSHTIYPYTVWCGCEMKEFLCLFSLVDISNVLLSDSAINTLGAESQKSWRDLLWRGGESAQSTAQPGSRKQQHRARSLSQVSKGEEMRNEKIWVSTNNKTLCNLFCGNLSFASPSHFVDVIVVYDLSCLFVFPPVKISSPWLWSALCVVGTPIEPDRLSHPTSKIGVRKKLSWHGKKK